jgi:hypothetical protein
MKQLFIHNPFFRILCPPAYGLVVYLLVLLVFDSVGQITQNFFSQEVLLCIILTYLLSESLRLMIVGFNRFFPVAQKVKVRTAMLVIANMLCSMLVISGGVAIYFYFIVGYTTFQVELITLNSIYLLTSLFYTMLYLSIYYLQTHSKEKLAQETALRKKMEHQLSQLKRDVNPELLYNSLETLISLVQQEATKAEDFIDHLSSVYRFSLDHRHKELTTLKSELTALHSLVYLYNQKFYECIRIHATISAAEQNLLLIPGSLLDIMEDSILSTIITPQHPLSIDLFVENDFVALHYVCNDKLLPRNATQETITRLSQTYRFFTDKPIVYHKTANECLIKMPLVQVEPESSARPQQILSHHTLTLHPSASEVDFNIRIAAPLLEKRKGIRF